jgi:hypothetical protein
VKGLWVVGEPEFKHALSVPRQAAARFLGGQLFVSFINEIDPLPTLCIGQVRFLMPP